MNLTIHNYKYTKQTNGIILFCKIEIYASIQQQYIYVHPSMNKKSFKPEAAKKDDCVIWYTG